MTETKSEILKLVRSAYDALETLNCISWTSYRDRLLDLCKEEEKGHRNSCLGPESFAASHESDTPGITDCAKMYVVHRIAEYLTGAAVPTVKDYLHTQQSCFYAAALVAEYRDRIEEAWKGFDVAQLATLNYTQLVVVKKAMAA